MYHVISQFFFFYVYHFSVLVYVTRFLWCSQQGYETSKQLVLLELQDSQLLISLNFISVHFVQRHFLVIHMCQNIAQVSQALPNIRAAT